MESIKRASLDRPGWIAVEVFSFGGRWIAQDNAGIVATSGNTFADQCSEWSDVIDPEECIALDREAFDVSTTGEPWTFDKMGYEAQALAREWGWPEA
jgi:hypothetical protein